MSLSIAGRQAVADRLQTAVDSWKKGKGSMLFVRAEPGMGKTHLSEAIEKEVGKEQTIRVECAPPIGKFNLAGIQPLQPFGKAIEQLYMNGEKTAKRRLAMNIGMSLLASLPIAGDIFYAVKAISQDVSEYQKETAATTQKKKAAVMQCVETLEKVSKEAPFVLLVDDGQWCDPQSIEVLKLLSNRIKEIPLLIVWTVSPRLAQQSNLPLSSFLREKSSVENTLELGQLDSEGVKDVLSAIAPSLKPNDEQLKTFKDRSAGSPGILVEYVKYLRRTGMVNEDGTLKADALEESGVKLSDHPATDMALHEVGDEDALLLGLAALEGQEFTAFMFAALTNTNVITAVRTLRRLEHETGTIKSIGMRTRYGLKTTVYTFSQNVAYTYFLHYMEYEERKHIHQRIAEVLSKEHDSSEIDEVKHQIATLIAAHATEAEDDDMARIMLNEAAMSAEAIGATETAELIRNEFLQPLSIDLQSESGELKAEGGGGNAEGGGSGEGLPTSSSDLINAAVQQILSGDPEGARLRASKALSDKDCTPRERLILHCLAARAEIELERFADAARQLDLADAITDAGVAERCIVLNVRSILAAQQQDLDLADTYLREAARMAGRLPTRERVLTLANIVVLGRNMPGDDHKRFETSLSKILEEHSLTALREDVGLHT